MSVAVNAEILGEKIVGRASKLADDLHEGEVGNVLHGCESGGRWGGPELGGGFHRRVARGN